MINKKKYVAKGEKLSSKNVTSFFRFVAQTTCLLCLYFETSSDCEFLMFSFCLLFLSAISSFKFKQRLQRSEFLLIGAQYLEV